MTPGTFEGEPRKDTSLFLTTYLKWPQEHFVLGTASDPTMFQVKVAPGMFHFGRRVRTHNVPGVFKVTPRPSYVGNRARPHNILKYVLKVTPGIFV